MEQTIEVSIELMELIEDLHEAHLYRRKLNITSHEFPKRRIRVSFISVFLEGWTKLFGEHFGSALCEALVGELLADENNRTMLVKKVTSRRKVLYRKQEIDPV